MRNRLTLLLLLFGLAFTLSALAIAQDKMKDEKKMDDKMAMSKSDDMTGPLKSISCDDKCGFMMKSRDEKELMSGAMAHMKKHHPDMKMSKKEMMGMIKTEGDMKK